VFPTKGDRPEQNKMSGGDLDGDVYFVSWEPTLIAGIKIHEPSNFKELSKVLENKD